MITGFDERYAALAARDARFDGAFVFAVRTTGVYCRPSCPARTPRPGNVTFYRTAAAAHEAGFRACKRCQPDAVPGSPEWRLRDDLASRAMRLVQDGVVEREGVGGLARRLGYSTRHLGRVLRDELGAGPLALARAHRAQTARALLASTDLPVADVAFAAGFGSLRQFNDTIAEIYRETPTRLRALARRDGTRGALPAAPGELVLRLPARAPFDAGGLLRWFAAHAIPGLEHGDGTSFRRPFRLPGGLADVTIRAAAGRPGIEVAARLATLADVTALTGALRRMLDLDADAPAIDDALGRDPVLAPLVAAVPGIRIAGVADPAEAVVRALVGQQVSISAARTLLGRMTAELGDGGFPAPAVIAERGAAVLRGPARRVRAILAAAEALASGTLPLDAATPVAELRAGLLALPGVGPWTADCLALRVLGAPDVLPSADLVIRRQAARLGLPAAPAALAAHGARWAPWRSYAALHLWRAAHGA